jgi:hypothetical protein
MIESEKNLKKMIMTPIHVIVPHMCDCKRGRVNRNNNNNNNKFFNMHPTISKKRFTEKKKKKKKTFKTPKKMKKT